jgi:hypothetical protein
MGYKAVLMEGLCGTGVWASLHVLELEEGISNEQVGEVIEQLSEAFRKEKDVASIGDDKAWVNFIPSKFLALRFKAY